MFKICWYCLDNEQELYDSIESVGFVLEHRSMLQTFFETMRIIGRQRRLNNLFKKVPNLRPLRENVNAQIKL